MKVMGKKSSMDSLDKENHHSRNSINVSHINFNQRTQGSAASL